jgi:hypothetical protein
MLKWILSISLSGMTRIFNTTSWKLLRNHKWNQSNYNRLDSPERVPTFWMEVTKRSANLFIDIESSRRCKHEQRWWLHWILRRETNPAMIESSFVVTVCEAKYQKVPNKYVFLIRKGNKIIKLFTWLNNPAFLLKTHNPSVTCH